MHAANVAPCGFSLRCLASPLVAMWSSRGESHPAQSSCSSLSAGPAPSHRTPLLKWVIPYASSSVRLPQRTGTSGNLPSNDWRLISYKTAANLPLAYRGFVSTNPNPARDQCPRATSRHANEIRNVTTNRASAACLWSPAGSPREWYPRPGSVQPC